MTVDAALALRGHRMEYILAIEGVGWSSDDADPFSSFDGDVWTTADLDGDLATKLGCTIHHGLSVRGSIGDSVDMIEAVYHYGQLSFQIVSSDDWWVENFTPRKAGNETALDVALDYAATTVRLTDGTNFVEDDVVWLGGREAVLLGTKALVGGVIYDYSGSTRGYLGTLRGRTNGAALSTGAFTWPADDTTVYERHRFWADRAMRLYAHVPGEARADMALLWVGKLSGISTNVTGITVDISGVGDVVRDTRRVWRPHELQAVSPTLGSIPNLTTPLDTDNPAVGPDRPGYRALELRPQFRNVNEELGDNKYALAAAYRYRTEVGGTAGMRSAWDAGNVQALDSANGNDVDIIHRFLLANEQTFRVLKRHPDSNSPHDVACERYSSLGDNTAQIFDQNTGEPNNETQADRTVCRFLLDNWSEAWETNDYAVNQKVVRHPINVFLSHLTTQPDEYFLGDAAAGSTTSAITFSGTTFATDMWVGAALHCVEGNNKGQARLITANTGTVVTVDEAFDGGAVAVGDEFQVRNSIYDTLPLGWGLGVPWTRVDIDSFETVRDANIPDARVGKFMIGTQDKLDLWQLLQNELLAPYGVMVYFDRTTGKLSAQYIGSAAGDGIVNSYVTVADSDIIEIGDIDNNISAPLGTINVKVRAREAKVITTEAMVTQETTIPTPFGTVRTTWVNMAIASATRNWVPGPVGGDETVIAHRLSELESFHDNNKDEASISAKFNSADDIETVSMRCYDLLRQYAVPPPTAVITLGPPFMTSVRAGSYLTISKTEGVVNPYTGARGWTDMIAFVTGTELLISNGPGIRCNVMLLEELDGGWIAPACKLAGAFTGSDGTSDWFEVEPNEFSSDSVNDKDYYGFTVGDKLHVYDEDGSENAATVYTIRSFGANDSATPEGASTDIVRINEAAPGGMAATNYIGFRQNFVTDTAAMIKHASWGDTAGLAGTGDPAKNYI